MLTTDVSQSVAQFTGLQVAPLINDNMVVQRDQQFEVRGWADEGTEVAVTVREQTEKATAGPDGRWSVTMDAVAVGPAFAIEVRTPDETKKFTNCVAGEVWICSGQSNMEWTVAGSGNPAEEIAAANHPGIRHIKIERNTPSAPNDGPYQATPWEVCTPETAGEFTAVGYYFARHLNQELGVPIGLINTSWGGTIVETWTSGESMKTVDAFRNVVAEIEAAGGSAEQQLEIKAQADAWVADFMQALTDESDNWQADDIDDSTWEAMSLPSHWEQHGLSIDGVVWFRKTVDIPETWAGRAATLSLGTIDDNDRTWVEQTLVGNTDGWNQERNYEVDPNLINAGELTITVRCVDGSGAGGICGDAAAMKLSVEGEEPISLAGDWKYKVGTKTAALGERPTAPFNGPNHPTLLYNGMVHPILDASFRGAIWYQGESNAGRAHQYQTLFPLLINDWRKQFGREFPFYWVQLANFTQPNDLPGDSDWAELREAQNRTLRLPQTGQAVIIDIGEANDIHPKNKQDVGRRLALLALKNDYGKDVVASGPAYESMVLKGNQIRLTFDHVADGLRSNREGTATGALQRFQIAGEDQKFVWADAVIDGNDVVVSSDRVSNPIAVRYAWSNNPEGCNLYNSAGLPASPFRTDVWRGITQTDE